VTASLLISYLADAPCNAITSIYTRNHSMNAVNLMPTLGSQADGPLLEGVYRMLPPVGWSILDALQI
jgi:hypothetical protein